MRVESTLSAHSANSSVDESMGDSSSLLNWARAHESQESIESVSFRESILESTRSLDESELESIEENGRTYHKYKNGKYSLPNDLLEQDRMDLQHELYLHTLSQKLYLAPISGSPRRVLDLATGTGTWAIQFAEQHPNSEVLGTDLSPIQPAYVPPNCYFEIDDAEDEWNFSQPFDFIHARSIYMCFNDPAAIFRSAFAHLVPGGWLELQNIVIPIQFANGTAPPDSAIVRWVNTYSAGIKSIGKDIQSVGHYKRWLEEAGFEDVVERRFYWPTSPWADGNYFKISGALFQADLARVLNGATARPLIAEGLSMEQVRELEAQVLSEIRDVGIQAYAPVSFVYAKKPITAPT